MEERSNTTEEVKQPVAQQSAPAAQSAEPAVAQKSSSMETTTGEQRRVRKLGDFFTGRRKTAIARVKITRGSGKITVNKKELENYFGRQDHHNIVKKPLIITENTEAYDILVNVSGGGESAQAGAISLGIARAIDAIQPEKHKTLRQEGLLTRDPRMVERKKYGLHKARRATQFSKR